MGRYWLRIAIGAVAIFVIGMLVVTFARRGVAKAKQVVVAGMREGLGNLPEKVGPIGIAGSRFGTINRLHIFQDDSAGHRVMTVTVKPDSAAAAALASCPALVGTRHDLFPKDSLVCLTDTLGADLGRIGTVEFTDSLAPRPLFAHGTQYRDFLRDRDQDEVDLRADSAGHAQIFVHDSDGQVVRINAGKGGASIDIRDASGKPVFQLNADSSGNVRMHATDSSHR